MDSLTQAQNTQALGGYGDYVGYVKGNALTASVYGNEESRFFSVAAIGMNGGQGRGDLLVNTTSFYQGAVRLPSNKDSLVFIVKAVGAWVISLNTSDPDNLFDTNKIALKSNPYSPFNDFLEEPTATPAPKATITAAPSAIAKPSTGTINRDANLRAGPGTNYN